MLEIIEAKTTVHVRAVRLLFEEYAASLNFSLYFQEFAEELAQLPGRYAPPQGRLLLALYEQQPAGCVALRKLENGVCEMKRLYVRPYFRNLKIGKSLAIAVIKKARKIGYLRMRLDTVPIMERARSLYESLGFREIAPYYENPVKGAKFLELKLDHGVS